MSLWGDKESTGANTGTLSIASNGQMTGTGTLFETELSVGGFIRIGNYEYQVKSISNNTLGEVYPGGPATSITTQTNTTFTVSTKPTIVAHTSGENANAIVFIDRTEIADSNVRSYGIRSPGWVKVVSYVDSTSTRRFRIEPIVPISRLQSDSGNITTALQVIVGESEANVSSNVLFGALTLGGHGGYPLPDGATAISSAGNTNLTVANGMIVPASNGVANDVITFDNGDNFTIETVADTYFVATGAELSEVHTSVTDSNMGGKAIGLRPNVEYDVSQTGGFVGFNPPSPYTIYVADESVAFDGGYTSDPSRSTRIVFYKYPNESEVGGWGNVVVNGVCIEGYFDRRNSGDSEYVMRSDAGFGPATFNNCWFKGDNDVIGDSSNFRGVLGGDGNFILNGLVHCNACMTSHASRGWNITGNSNNEFRYENGVVRRFQGDGFVTGGSRITLKNNFIFGPATVVSDVSFASTKIGLVSARTGELTTGMVDSKSALMFLRFKPRSVGTSGSPASAVETIVSFGEAGGTKYGAWEVTTVGKLRFWMKDAGGTTIVDISSNDDLLPGITTCVLLSIDTDVETKMFLWMEGGSQVRAATTDVATANTTGGETLNFQCDGLALGGEDQGTSAPAAAYAGVISRFFFKPGVSANVESSTVQGHFFDSSTPLGDVVPVATAATEYGTPPVDAFAGIDAWRSNLCNQGNGGTLTLRSSNISIDIFHIDMWQSIVNGNQSQAIDGYLTDDVPPSVFENNVWFAGDTDDPGLSNSGQALFKEDIGGFANDVDCVARYNLFIGSSTSAMRISNPLRAKFRFNTLVTMEDFIPVGQSTQTTYAINMQNHNPYGDGKQLTLTKTSNTEIVAGETFELDSGANTTSGYFYVFGIVSQNTTDAVIWINFSNDADSGRDPYPAGYSDPITDGAGFTFHTSNTTANAVGTVATVTSPGIANNSGHNGGNISHDITDTTVNGLDPINGLPPADTTQNHNVIWPTRSVDDSLLPNYFEGSAGNGVGFSANNLTSKAAMEQMFATLSTLRANGEVKMGWDAGYGDDDPFDGTCDSFAIANLTNQEISSSVNTAAVIPANVSNSGIVMWAWDSSNTAVGLTLLESNDDVVVANTTNPIHLMPGQKFKLTVSTTSVYSNTQVYTVYGGGQSAPVSIITKADTDAPLLSNATAISASPGSFTGTVDTATDPDGTLYYVATTSSTKPSAAQVKAGQDNTGAAAQGVYSQAVSNTGTQVTSGAGLSPSTEYNVWYMHEDSDNNQSLVTDAATFTTEVAAYFDDFSANTEGNYEAVSGSDTLEYDSINQELDYTQSSSFNGFIFSNGFAAESGVTYDLTIVFSDVTASSGFMDMAFKNGSAPASTTIASIPIGDRLTVTTSEPITWNVSWESTVTGNVHPYIYYRGTTSFSVSSIAIVEQ